MNGPERRAVLIARRLPYIAPRKLAKLAGVHVEVAKRVIDAEQARRTA